MRRVGNSHTNSPLPAPGSASGSAAMGGQATKSVGSNGKIPKADVLYIIWMADCWKVLVDPHGC